MTASVVARHTASRYGSGDVSVTLNGGGSNRAIVAICSIRAGTGTDCTATINGTESAVQREVISHTVSGKLIRTSFLKWTDSQHPGAGAATFNFSWTTGAEQSIVILELQDVTNTDVIATPITDYTAGNVPTGTTHNISLVSATSKLAFAFWAGANSSFFDSTFSTSANLSNQAYSDNTYCHTVVYEDSSVSTSPEAYDITFTKTAGTDPASVVFGAFYILEAITGPVVTGPSTATENSSATVTGTNMDSISVLGLVTADENAYDVTQTQSSPTPTQVTVSTVDTGFNTAYTSGTTTDGVPMVTSVNADGYTAWNVRWDADSSTDGSVYAVAISPRSGILAVQAMTSGIDAANITDGESFFGSSIIAVEDNMQLFVDAVGSEGGNLTLYADGTFLIDDATEQTVKAVYWSPSTGQYSRVIVTISEDAIVVPPAGTITFGSPTIGNTTISQPFTYDDVDYDSFEYKVGVGGSWSSTTSPISLSGLTPSTSYTIYARAINTAGDGTVFSTTVETIAQEASVIISCSLGMGIFITRFINASGTVSYITFDTTGNTWDDADLTWDQETL